MKNLLFKNGWPAVLGLSVLLTGLNVWMGLQFTPLRQIENWLADLRVSAFELDASKLDNPVVMVTITEDTLAQMPYRSPLDRAFLAQTLALIDKAQPRAVGLDVLLDQPTESGKDRALRSQILSMRSPIFVAWAGNREGLTERQAAFLEEYVPLKNRARVNMIRDDSDGIIRQVKTNSDDGLPALSSALSGQPRSTEWLYWVRKAGDVADPVFPRYPAHQLKLIPPQWLNDKIVLIGADLPVTDRHRTSLTSLLGLKEGTRSGAEIHSQAILNQLNGLGMNQLPMLPQTVLVWLMTLVGLVSGRLLNRAFYTVPLLMALGGGLLLLDHYLLTQWLSIVWLVVPMMAAFMGMGLGVSLSSRQHRAEKQFIKKAMSHYVAPQIVSDLQKNPERLSLGGKRQLLSMVFTDIAGFTSLSESVPAELLVRHLNEYLDGVSRQITDHGGIVDKFIGDAVVALFNTPLPQADHAQKAVECALAIDAFAERFRQKAVEAGLAWGETRIGVHSDEVIVGNMGGLERFDYTAIGDGMNTAARLEGANKYLGTRLCVSESTVARLAESVRLTLGLTPVRRVQMVGQSREVLVYTSFGRLPNHLVKLQDMPMTLAGAALDPDGPVLILGGK